MAIPGYSQTIKKKGLGLVQQATDTLIILATASDGPTNTLTDIGDPDDAVSTFAAGPLAEAAAYATKSNVAVKAMRVDTSEVGTVGSVTKAPSSGGATLDVSASSPIDDYDVKVKVVSGGLIGVAKIAISLDDGATYGPTVLATQGYAVPGSLVGLGADPGITLSWTGTLQADDVYSFACTRPIPTTAEATTALAALIADPTAKGVVYYYGADPTLGLTSVKSSGTTPPAVTVSGTPASSAYEFRIEITTGGAVATAVFRWSSNNGATWTSTVTTASTVALGSTGVTVAFAAGTYNTNNVYRFTPKLSNVGALLAVADAKATTAFAAKKRLRFLFDAGEAQEAACEATVDGLDYDRVSLAHSSALVTSDLTSLDQWRPVGMVAAVRAVAGGISNDPASGVTTDPLRAVKAISRDEATATRHLDDAHLVTPRTWEGRDKEYYVTNYWTLAGPGSDYQQLPNCRIIDAACDATYGAMLKYSSARIARNIKTGFIDEVAARNIEIDAGEALAKALLQDGHAEAASIKINRSTTLVGPSAKLKWKTSVVPPGYAKQLEEELSLSVTA